MESTSFGTVNIIFTFHIKIHFIRLIFTLSELELYSTKTIIFWMIGIVAWAIGQDICVKFTEKWFLHEWQNGDEDARGRRNDDKRGEAADYRDDWQEGD